MSRKKTSVTNIADALRCMRKLRSGRPCTIAELKSVALILESAYKNSKSRVAEMKDRMNFMERMMNLRN